MKSYWPEAIIVTDNGPDKLFTYNAVTTIEKANAQFEIWEKHYNYKIAARWIESEDGHRKETINKQIYREHIKELWEQLGNVPVNEDTDCIEEWWGSALWNNSFCPGTKREDIWRWFEGTFEVSVAEDLMASKSTEANRITKNETQTAGKKKARSKNI